MPSFCRLRIAACIYCEGDKGSQPHPYTITIPPFTCNVCPVTYRASALAR